MSGGRVQVIADLCRIISALPDLPDHAGAVHAAVVEAISADGHKVYVEMPSNEADRAGRIDIVFFHEREHRWVAIEIDARKPRRRSIVKLLGFAGMRICMLRGVGMKTVPHGIDAVLAIPVRTAEEGEKDRAAVGKAVRRVRAQAA